MEDECCSTQLIDGDGMFNMAGLEGFTKAVRLGECGLSYAVVSIMGPQSSGKSTLLNQLFKTNFREMDAFRGRSQTTKGIWIAKCRGIEPCTIVMDLEGTDGRERGEDDTTFEKQSSLFALAVSDIVLINMWCHDIGREQAANKPLLKTVFQVMMRLFSPRRTTLLFVIRDKTKTPLEHLEPVLREDIQKIWDGVSKPEAHKSTPLSDFFNVEVTALPSYEEKEEQFRDQVAQLRQRFSQSIAPGGLAGDRRGVIPASGFSFSAQEMWKVIKENKDLDLPAHKVMVATVRCEEIANEKLSHLASDESWLDLEQAVQSGPVLGFGKSLAAILDTHFSEYDAETAFFDEGVRTAKRQQLESRALHMVHPAYNMMLGHLRSKALDSFKKGLELSLKKGEGFTVSLCQCTESSLHEFDLASEDLVLKQADWNPSKVREKLVRDIDTHAASVCAEKLSELVTHFENQLSNSLDEPVESLLEAAGLDTWPSVRKIFKRETDDSILGFSKSLVGFKLDDKTQSKMIENLKNFARGIVEKRAKEEAGKILIKMKDRFSSVFSHDKDSMPRVWTGKEDIRVITKDARTAALKLLAVMAAIRLDERQDKIESILFLNLIDSNAAREKKGEGFADPLASSTWEGIPSKDTLITPVQCKQTWRRLNAETEYTVAQAMSAQEASKRNNNWLPPPWAIIALGILGFNEFMMLLKNPFYIMAIFTVFLVAKALWVQLDVAAEFQHGLLPGVIAISSRLIPTIMNILNKLAEEGNQPPPSPANQQPASPRPPPPPPRLPERRPGLQRSPLSFKGDSPRRTPRSYSMPVASPLASTLSSSDGSREQMNPFMDSEFDKSAMASGLS